MCLWDHYHTQKVATKGIPECVDNLTPDEFSEEVVLTFEVLTI